MSNESSGEAYRPQYHFSAQTGWINDPNGLVFYKGRYHLFFQHNPFGTEWGNMTWGHAVSTDLLHWQQLENALLPDSLGTMFSGSAVMDWHNTSGLQSGSEKAIVALYTAAGGTSEESKGQPFTQCLAYSTDAGDTLIKYKGNPVLPNIVKENRDPKVAWYAPGGHWVMALYLDGNTFALFASPDLKAWERLQTIEMNGCSECPDFFEMSVEGDAGEKRWVLTAANGRYFVGRFDGRQFVPDTTEPLQVDFGANYYAVQTYSDTPDGRRIQITWMAGGKYPGMVFNQQMSFPCEMKLVHTAGGLRLTRWPVAEIEHLYSATRAWRDISLAQPIVLSQHDLLDLTIECDVLPDAEFVLDIHGERLIYNAAHGTVSCLGKTASLAPVIGHIALRVLVDRASIEVFGNGGVISMTSCFTPDASAIETVLYGSGATVTSLIVHELASARA